MSAHDGRSVGEMLLHADTATRALLFDVGGDDAPAMLRTWGEVVQNAAELWQVLPAHPKGDTAAGQLMPQLEAIAQGMHRTQLRQGWPGDGQPDQRLLGIAEDFGAARDLVTKHGSPDRGVRSIEEIRDVHAARTRILHILYVGAHSVGVAVREHIRELQQMPRVEQQWARATRGIPRGREALERLTAFEQLAGAHLGGGRFVSSLHGERLEEYAGLGRLADAVARWDIQAHRTLAVAQTPANLAAIARTQAMVQRTSLILVRAAALTGTADPVTYEQHIAPAFEQAIRAQARIAGHWGALTNAHTRRVDPDLWTVAEQLEAAMRELIHDKTALAEPTLIAQRADLRDLEPTVKRATVGGFILACDARDIATHNTSLAAPAKAMLQLARDGIPEAGEGDDDRLGASLSPTDLQHNRVRPLIEPVRGILVRDSDTA
ncbi:MAG: hypothetical protein L0H79_19405, partial [Intrasporangium sp.]|uniref:hypothetical protein n=1 Tax=Intrasporangium sp. TaxID=1925024 RepID=UPI0026478ECD